MSGAYDIDEATSVYQSRYRAGASKASPAEQSCDEQRFFDDLRSRIAIATKAAEAAHGNLGQVFERLGITRVYGTAETPASPISGVIDGTLHDIDALTDLTRNLRGLTETLEARL